MKPITDQQGATDQFWEDVEILLTGEHHRSPQKARRGINEHRREVDSHKLDGVVYNQGEEQVARVIDGLIEDGLPRRAGVRP